jgi:hypothetical protein
VEEINLVDLQPDIRKVLLIGAEGVGKTNFIKTMPRPIYCFSFDKGYLTLAGEDGIKVGLCMDDDRYKPKAYAEFKQKFDKLIAGEKFKYADGREEAYQTIALDNVSFLSDMVFDHLQKVNNNIDKPGNYAVYGLVKSYLQDVINKCVAVANYVVCTALLDATKDETTGEIFFTPNMVGSIKSEIGAWFDGVFYMTVDKTPDGKKQYKLITVGDRRQKAKIRLPSKIADSISAVEVPDFKLLMEKVNKIIKGGTK